MKGILSLILLLSVFHLHSQKAIILKDSTIIKTDKIKFKNGKLYYQKSHGKVITLKNRQYLRVIDTQLRTDEFEYNQLGLTDYVVTKIPNLDQNQLYFKTINWIKETYKDPDKVIKSTIEPKKVRINGSSENGFCIKAINGEICYRSTYSIIISFKDGRFKFEPISMSYYGLALYGGFYSEFNVNLSNGTEFYNKKGILRNFYKNSPKSISNTFNKLNKSLEHYLLKSQEKEDDW